VSIEHDRYQRDLEHLSVLEQAAGGPADLKAVFHVQMVWVMRQFLANLGCCPACLGRFDERYPGIATPPE
jgi:hypothetical protein